MANSAHAIGAGIAAELPLLAILELCGIPAEDRKDFFQRTNAMMFHQDPEMSASEEIFFEWFYMHLAWVGGLAGMITGLIVEKRKRIIKSEDPEISPAD